MALVERLPYTPWMERGSIVDGEFRWRLGVRPLDLGDWIQFGPDADGPDGWIADKHRLLNDHHQTVFAVLDDIEPEATEVAVALVDHLRERAPGRFGRFESDTTLHPLEGASRLVAEDLVLMVERDGRLVFGGGSVCFPNRWDLRSKLGLTMSAVHAPVARLNEQLGSDVDRFLVRLTPQRSYWRLGWGIIDSPDGYTPVDGSGPERSTNPAVGDLFVRVERETLRRLPTTNCVLFTIRTFIAPLPTVLRDPESATAIGRAVAAMAPAVREYKDLSARAGHPPFASEFSAHSAPEIRRKRR